MRQAALQATTDDRMIIHRNLERGIETRESPAEGKHRQKERGGPIAPKAARTEKACSRMEKGMMSTMNAMFTGPVLAARLEIAPDASAHRTRMSQQLSGSDTGDE